MKKDPTSSRSAQQWSEKKIWQYYTERSPTSKLPFPLRMGRI